MTALPPSNTATTAFVVSKSISYFSYLKKLGKCIKVYAQWQKLSIKCLILTVVGLLRFMTLSTFIFWILRYRCWFCWVKILGRILDSNTIWLKLYIFRLLICKISIILLEWTNTKFTVSLWQFFNVTERLRKKRFLNRFFMYKEITYTFI